MDIFNKKKTAKLDVEFKDKRKKYYEDKKTNIEFDIDAMEHNLEFSKAMLKVVEEKLKGF